ncbi:SDR family oxidoreductase, partial [bacterium M00.F.Ca.ET.194.01.1.1]
MQLLDEERMDQLHKTSMRILSELGIRVMSEKVMDLFAKAGAIVHATDINEAALAELAKTSGVRTRKLDVLNDDAVKAAFAEIGRVDVLFNCAGFVHAGSIL